MSELVRQHFWYTLWSDCFTNIVVMGSAKTQVVHMEQKVLEGTIGGHPVQNIASTRAESSAPIAYDVLASRNFL